MSQSKTCIGSADVSGAIVTDSLNRERPTASSSLFSVPADAGLAEEYVRTGRPHGRTCIQHARLHSHKGFFAEDGERCTIVVVEWKRHSAPGVCIRNIGTRSAKGAIFITKTDSLQICDVKRQSKFDRNARATQRLKKAPPRCP